jgi:PAS domain S-box-containing protein
MQSSYLQNRSFVDQFAVWAADFFDNLPVGVFRTTLEGTLLFCNKSFSEILGYDSPGDLKEFRVVNFYPNKKDRGHFVRLIIDKGWVDEFPIELMRSDGSVFTCCTSAKAVPDEDGVVVYIDGVMWEKTEKSEQEHTTTDLNGLSNTMTLVLDLQGNIVDINDAALQSFRYRRDELLGYSLLRFLEPRYKDEFDFLLHNIFDSEKLEGILAVQDKQAGVHQLEFQASLIKKDGEPSHIFSIARDVSSKINHMKRRLAREKFQGILEMAGGIAHNMNQPLMIINNLLQEVLSDLSPENSNYEKMERINDQIQKLNYIAKKIGSVQKYRVQDYVIGEKIVDIDRIS